MTISRKWWEPEPHDKRADSEGQIRPSFALEDVVSLANSCGEFAHLAELFCCQGCVRQSTTFPGETQ